MKRIVSIAISVIMVLSIFAGCSQKKDADKNSAATTTEVKTTEAKTTDDSKKPVTIKLFQAKVEIADAFNRFKEEYEKAYPGVTLEITTVASDNYGTTLKAKFAGGEAPDIFNNTGNADLKLWLSHLEDLSDQPWVKDVVELAKSGAEADGKLYGMPENFEGYGFLYNKDLFAKAGITEVPTTLTALTDAVEKLKKANITPFSSCYNDWFGGGFHMANICFARQTNPDDFFKGLDDGSAKITGNKIFEDWTQLIALESKNAKNPLTTDFNAQLNQFLNGEAAMAKGGTWTQPVVDKAANKFPIGVMPMPIDDDQAANDKVFVGVPYYWVIDKDSKVKPEAKELLNWLVSSETGKSYITKEFKFMPAFKSIQLDTKEAGDILLETDKYVKAGKILNWEFTKFPDGVAQEFGSSIQKFIAGKANRDQLLTEMQGAWEKFKAK